MSVGPNSGLRGKRAAVLLFSYYPSDPRPRRAAEALVNEGMAVELICLRASDQPARETFGGVDVCRLPLKRRRGGALAYLVQYGSFILSSFVILTLRSLRRRFDLVHVHNMPDILVFSSLVPKLRGARVILDLHDPMPELMRTIFGLAPTRFGVRVLQRLERWSIAFADVVFTVNLACKRIFSFRSCPAEKVEVVMNSPDEAIFSLRAPSDSREGRKPFVIMYHGLIVERNGLDVAVEALRIARRQIPHAELRIYGEATLFLEQVMTTVRKTGLHECVRHLGRQSLEEIVAAIDGCDVGVIPNRRSVFTEINTPTRIFEYLSRGKPVITGRAPGVEDYFDNDSIFYFRLGDASDLASRLVQIASGRTDLPSIVKRGQQVYLTHRWCEERQRMIGRITALLS